MRVVGRYVKKTGGAVKMVVSPLERVSVAPRGRVRGVGVSGRRKAGMWVGVPEMVVGMRVKMGVRAEVGAGWALSVRSGLGLGP